MLSLYNTIGHIITLQLNDLYTLWCFHIHIDKLTKRLFAPKRYVLKANWNFIFMAYFEKRFKLID